MNQNNKDLLTTPLFEKHKEIGAKMVEFGGWLMPVSYAASGILAEHQNTRSGCSVFDICHMGELFISGPGAAKALDKVLTAKVLKAKPGTCKYGFILNNEAGVIDDCITYCLEEDQFMIVTNAARRQIDLDWMQRHLPDSVTIDDRSDTIAKIDVQGPDSVKVMKDALALDLSGLRFFRFDTFSAMGTDFIISRTGYTGELGFEVYMPSKRAVEFWEKVTAAGAQPAGLGARDTLRIEAGLPLYGHELDEETTPVEADLQRFADKDREFIGMEVVQAQLLDLPEEKLFGLVTEGRQSPREGHVILDESGYSIGRVTSGAFIATLGHPAAFGFIDRSAAVAGHRCYVDTGRKKIPGSLHTVGFLQKD